jgi:hypothetical protein
MLRVKPRLLSRRNEAFVRQGEWLFVPLPEGTLVNDSLILRNEPLRRGLEKPHIVDELARDQGEPVYVCAAYPHGMTPREYQKLISRRPELRGIGWAIRRRSPRVFARGEVRHPDHKTVKLEDWRLAARNAESRSTTTRQVAFVD